MSIFNTEQTCWQKRILLTSAKRVLWMSNDIIIVEETNADKKQNIAGNILEALPDWFGIPESRERYIKESANQPFFAAYDSEKPVGFLCLKETGKETVELCVMGVLKEYHRKGVGRKLFERAKEMAVRRRSPASRATPLCRSRRFKWDDTQIMTPPTVFICRLGLKSLKYSQHYGMSGIRVRYMSWRFDNIR